MLESGYAGIRSPGKRHDPHNPYTSTVAQMTQVPRLVSMGLMAILIILLGVTFFHVLAPFLLPLFVAGVLAMLSQPLHQRMLRWSKNRPTIAAGMTSAVVLISIMVPLGVGTVMGARQMYAFAGRALHGAEWKEMYSFVNEKLQLQEWQRWIHEATGEPGKDDAELELELQEKLKSVANSMVAKTVSMAGSTPSLLGHLATTLVSILTFVVAYYYFLCDGPELLAAAERLVPVHRAYKRQLLGQFEQAVRAVVVATFAAAIGQGVATGIGMQICGARSFFILTLLATITALVPLLGTWLIWGPYVLWLGFHDGDWVRAGLLAAYGSVVVGLLDNVIRAYVLHSNVKLHPLLAFVSVMGGIELMGLWGLFVGPVIASCLHALVKIFNTELFEFARRPADVDEFDHDADFNESTMTDAGFNRQLPTPTVIRTNSSAGKSATQAEDPTNPVTLRKIGPETTTTDAPSAAQNPPASNASVKSSPKSDPPG